ncbi:Potassium transporter [Dillenia turbinata]|uniref:Potassium transporter n=1 Tax=Dillenia turbinata TaxID=194707 RepID=A0AAN8ZP44_9MAGN
MSSDVVIGEHKEEEKQEVFEERSLNGRKHSRQKLGRSDSLDIESGHVHGHRGHSFKTKEWSVILHLAFQSIGIVYGDIGTSPLYVYSSTFGSKINHEDDILGVLSLILYTLTLIPLIKYVLIVLKANDNGDGGTFALYSLICRYAKVGLIPSQQIEDQEVSNYKLQLPNSRTRRASKLRSALENSLSAKYFLLFATMLGTSMVIGDGVLTPCISVLSAVGGIKEATSKMTEGKVVLISVVILVCLFMVQRFGTDKVGYSFAPIICVWFLFIGGIGAFNFFKYDPGVLKAIYPKYIFDYFQRNKKQAWVSLGGVVLAITGTEALFADVGHFTVRSIQISMCTVTYPALVLAYTGQASFLRKHMEDVEETFYKSIPKPLYWPTFGVAVAASIIASQAMISGTFSIIQQSLSLGCFPRVKVVHTSTKYEGQVYIPEINYLLMIACVGVTLGFRDAIKIGNAYGIAVVFVMTLTSSFLVLIMIMIWKTNILAVMAYVIVIGSVELIYLSSVLYKFDQGGYLPLAFAAVLMTIMFVWNNVYRRKYHYELDHKISPEKLKETILSTNTYRIPGLGIFYSELVHGIPPIFNHYVSHVSALHSVLVFVSIKSLPISKVPQEERFLFRRVDPDELHVYRCVVRYGYSDVRSEHESFEMMLVQKLKEFVREGHAMKSVVDRNEEEKEEEEESAASIEQEQQSRTWEEAAEKDVQVLERAWRAGVVHLIGESEVIAGKGANIGKKILIDYVYNILRRNLRQTDKVLDIPHRRLLKVGMAYEL